MKNGNEKRHREMGYRRSAAADAKFPKFVPSFSGSIGQWA
jgi:hypothetical protein